MGCYVNPKGETKEKWLEENGELIQDYWFPGDKVQFKPYEAYCVDNKLPVIMVDNGLFRAAAVAYSESEFKVFTAADDPRPRKVYVVPIEKLKEVSDIEDWLRG